jgi:hypothetical protein
MRPFLLLALLLLPACGSDLDFVRVQRLAVAGDRGDGQTVMTAGPALHITVKIASDATEFDPTNLMRLVVNGTDRTSDVTVGGEYAVLTLDPAPVGAPQSVELYTRSGTMPVDTAVYEAAAFAGPMLFNVLPDTARVGAQVTVAGSGLDAGPLRVFFGGVEGAVVASTASSITATVPVGAEPGLVFVLVGDDSARGLVPFQPLDDMDQPVPRPAVIRLHYAAPAKGGIEAVVAVAGFNFTNEAYPQFNELYSTRLFNVQTLSLPPIGDVTTAFAVVAPYTDPGPGTLMISEHDDSNELPFTVE